MFSPVPSLGFWLLRREPTDARYGPEGGFLPLLATKLTQSPWFLNTPKVFQPPFLHWSVDVGSVAIDLGNKSVDRRRGSSGRPQRSSGNRSRPCGPSRRRCPRRPRRCRSRNHHRCRPGRSNRPARSRSRPASSQRRRMPPAWVVWAASAVVGKLVETRVARHVGAARAVHGDASAEISVAAAQVGRIDQPGSGRVQLGHKGVGNAASVGRLGGPCGRREIGRDRRSPSRRRCPRRPRRCRQPTFNVAAAQVGRVDQPGAGRVQLRHEGVVSRRRGSSGRPPRSSGNRSSAV